MYKLKKNIWMGFVFMLVNITSVLVVTQAMQLSISLALLMTGINTLIFRFITKQKLSSVLGISGLYITPILYISQKYGNEYVMGGVIASGVMYVIYSLIMFKYQDKILKYIPNYLLSTIILLIGINLIPIGSNLVNNNLLVGLSALFTMLIIQLFAKNKVKLFSMPLGILAGTLIFILQNKGFQIEYISQLDFQHITPKINLDSFFMISLTSLGVVFEAFGDSKNTGNAMNINIYKEVGLGRVFLGNGIGNVLNGLFGSSAPATTFSEQNSALQITKYRDTKAVVFTSIFFILLAFSKPFISFVLSIPIEAFGGVLILLFATVISSSIQQIAQCNEIRIQQHKTLLIIGTMIAINFITFNIYNIQISSLAIASVIGFILNGLLMKEDK